MQRVNHTAIFCFLFVGCQLPQEQYVELRQEQDCRIFGPQCIGDYQTVAECLGDEASSNRGEQNGTYDGLAARECIIELGELCPVRAVDYEVPPACKMVYSTTKDLE